VKALGADVVIPFAQPFKERDFEGALIQEFGNGIQVVVDYLWGQSARTIIAAIAKGVDDGAPVRFVHAGGASGEENIDLPGAGLRSSFIVLMGSGYKSVPLPALFAAVKSTFDATIPAKLQIATKAVSLVEVEQHWNEPGKPRVVFTIG
jgi:hypothetical protein